LDAGRQAELEAHLSACATCQGALGELRNLQVLLRRLGDVEAPADLAEGVRRRLAEATARPRASWSFRLPGHELALAVTVLLIVFVVVIPFYLRPFPSGPAQLAEPSKAAHRMPARRKPPVVVSADKSSELSRSVLGDRLDGKNAVATYRPQQYGLLERGAGEISGELSHGRAGQRDAEAQKPQDRRELKAAFEGTAEPQLDAFFGQATDQTEPIDAGVLAGVPAAAAPESRVMPSQAAWPAVRLQWHIADRPAALKALTIWTDRTPSARFAVDADHAVLRIPVASMVDLFHVLAAHGPVSDQKVLEDDEANRLALTSTGEFQQAPQDADGLRSVVDGNLAEPLMTIELLLVSPSE